MRCNEFDTFIDEMLSGVLYPEASQHMRQCERCASHLHARSKVQHELRKLALARLPGPSSATDRAVMDSYRQLQQRRTAAGNSGSALAPAAAATEILSFPKRGMAPARTSRVWWSGAAAAAVLIAVLGSAAHLWNGVPTVNAPVAVTAPVAPALQQRPSDAAMVAAAVVAPAIRRRSRAVAVTAQSRAPKSNLSLLEIATAGFRPEEASPTAANPHATTRSETAYEARNQDSTPVSQLPTNIVPVVQLATAGGSAGMAQPASSTWPGYSNLMYCDPVVCSGPMQVVHIKVPAGQVKASPGQNVGNGFVGADVMVGADGVPRAIRVAN